MMPPPRAVIMPRVRTPTMSRRAACTAVNAPLSANTKVPVRSSASSSGDSVVIAGVYPSGRASARAAHSPATVVVDVSVGDLYAAGRDPALGGLDPLMVAAELGEREKPWEVRSVRDSRAFGAALGRWGLDG